MIHIVVGMGYGDEGKGRVVSWLSRFEKNSIVIRFNGGSQAGHTVVDEKGRHVFSHFGSGTLNGILTYWSKYCPIMPINLHEEGKALQEILGFKDWTKENLIKFDPMCPITTHFDILANQALEKAFRHGSVGLGFGKTIERHENTPYKLYAIDLLRPNILKEKLNSIYNYYCRIGVDVPNKDLLIEKFIDTVEEINFSDKISGLESENYDNLIFEGAQGVLLDQDHGVAFPHLTRSNTTIKNAVEIIKKMYSKKQRINNWFVSRTYLTRHGNGPLFGEISREELNVPIDKTNYENEWQGRFRYASFNRELFDYAYDLNCRYKDGLDIIDNIVFTHYDQKQIEEVGIYKNVFISDSENGNIKNYV